MEKLGISQQIKKARIDLARAIVEIGECRAHNPDSLVLLQSSIEKRNDIAHTITRLKDEYIRHKKIEVDYRKQLNRELRLGNKRLKGDLHFRKVRRVRDETHTTERFIEAYVEVHDRESVVKESIDLTLTVINDNERMGITHFINPLANKLFLN